MFPDSPLLNGAFIFILGMCIVFFGMLIIILFVTLAGKIFDKTSNEKQEKVKTIEEIVEPEPVAVADDEIPAEIKVAIIAAISSYYFTTQKSKCDFVVKRIKRL